MKAISIRPGPGRQRADRIETAAFRWLNRIGCFSLVAGAASMIHGERGTLANEPRPFPVPPRQAGPGKLFGVKSGSKEHSRPRLLQRQSSFRPFGQDRSSMDVFAGSNDCPGTIIPGGTYTAASPFTDSGDTTGANDTISSFGYYQNAYGPDHIYTFTIASLGPNPRIEVSTTSQTYNPEIYLINGLTYSRCPAGTANFYWWDVLWAVDAAPAGATETIGSDGMNLLPRNVPLHLFVDSAFGQTMSAGPYTITLKDATLSSTTPPPAIDAALDLDGSGNTDMMIARNAGGAFTWFTRTGDDQFLSPQSWGIDGDKLVPADFDGDGRDDLAVWRPGTQGRFYIIGSRDQTFYTVDFGQTGDDPSVAADYTGDGADDLAVYRPGTSAGAQSYWYYRPLRSPAGSFATVAWGQHGDRPVPGNLDGFGGADFTVQRAEGLNGRFYLKYSYGSETSFVFGLAGDMLVPGSYDTPGVTEIAVVRPGADGFLHWYIKKSWVMEYTHDVWGVAATDVPVPGDYDGRGRADLAVWRPGSPGVFFIRSLDDGGIRTRAWGETGDIPLASFRNH